MIEFRSPTVREVMNVAGSVIGIALVGMLGFALYALIYVKVPAENQSPLNLVIGILAGNVGLVVGYFFGSSSTDKKKTETIDTLAKTAQAAGVALSGTPDAITIPAGESATVTATDAGAAIQKDEHA